MVSLYELLFLILKISIIFFVFCVLSRLFFVRLIKFSIKNVFERNILIYGAGEAGAQSSLALMHSDKYKLVGCCCILIGVILVQLIPLYVRKQKNL